jgi:ribose-phosphate pyrophosphokinase
LLPLVLAGGAAAFHIAYSDDGEMIVFSGNANPELAGEIASMLGVGLGNITVARFADGEVNVQVHDNVRGKDVYIIQPTCSPVNEHLMELLLMVSTMRRASAERITCVIPYYGYARQDRKMTARVPISAADVARLLESMGVDRVIAVDLHCGQIQGFFGPRVPVDNLAAGVVGVKYFAGKELVNPVVISPDAGGVYRAKQFREGLNITSPAMDAGLAMIIKQRPKAGQIERMDLVGSVEGADCVIVDDMIDTAGTLCQAAEHLKTNGARKVYAFASHGLFSGPASDRIARSVLEEVVVTNTVPLKAAAKTNEKIVQLSVAPLVAETIKRVHLRQSVSDLFRDKRGKGVQF